MAEQIAFENIAFVRDAARQIQAVTAWCVTCRQERALCFAEVIGGVAMRCAPCGGRAVTRVDEVQSHSIEAFADALRRSEWHRAYATAPRPAPTRAQERPADAEDPDAPPRAVRAERSTVA